MSGHSESSLFSRLKSKIQKDFHFWEKYWIFLNSIFTGMLIGFGLSGYDITLTHPVIITIWCGLFVFDYIFGKRLK